jgi:hypothetical protein
MRVRYATRKVTGWKDRHLDQTRVMRNLHIRMRNGYSLTSEERQFWDDTVSLLELYNTEVSLKKFWEKIYT